jgi:hypothetical protein
MKNWEEYFGKMEDNINESIDDIDITLEDLLREYEVYNPEAFINYLDDNGYKIIKK